MNELDVLLERLLLIRQDLETAAATWPRITADLLQGSTTDTNPKKA